VLAIVDFDGTLTAEEKQAIPLAEVSLDTLSREIVGVPVPTLAADYAATRRMLLQAPHQYWWEVNGLVASYCDEGAFILNTTTLQVMLRGNPAYSEAVSRAFPEAEYDPIVDCTNYLFHRHTAELPPAFRPEARDVISRMVAHDQVTPIVLTNSLGDKVRRHMAALGGGYAVEVLGDTRQYDMDPAWGHHFSLRDQATAQQWRISKRRTIDLRRRVYYEALLQAERRDPSLVVIADTLSLPGALPLAMGIPFLLLSTSYTPAWCIRAVQHHPLGQVLGSLADLPEVLTSIAGRRETGQATRPSLTGTSAHQ
jgi:hypothetical protein